MIGLLAVTCLLGVAHAFPNGAPDLACSEMKPGHFRSSTRGENPFRLNISATSYKPGDVITGTLRGDGDLKFKGFLIEVGTSQSVDEREKAVGEFINLDDSMMKHVCEKGGITHVNNEEKTEISFTWQAPATSAGDLSFRATVVEVFKIIESKFWLGSFSPRVKAE